MMVTYFKKGVCSQSQAKIFNQPCSSKIGDTFIRNGAMVGCNCKKSLFDSNYADERPATLSRCWRCKGKQVSGCNGPA